MSGINASAAEARSAGVLAAGVCADCTGCSALGNGGLAASASLEVSRIVRRMASRFISATARAYPPLATPWAILTGLTSSPRLKPGDSNPFMLRVQWCGCGAVIPCGFLLVPASVTAPGPRTGVGLHRL